MQRSLQAWRSPVSWSLVTIVTAVFAGAALVVLGGQEGNLQYLAAAALIVVPIAIILFAYRPWLFVNAYIFVIPLLVGTDDPNSVNAGILATMGLLALATPGALLARHRGDKALTAIIWPLFALSVVGVASVVANSILEVGDIFNAVFKYASFGLIAVIVYRYNDTERKVKDLTTALLLAGVFVALYAIFNFVSGRNYYAQYGFSRAAGTFENWNELGGYMALVSFPLFFFGLSRKSLIRALCFAACGAEIVAMLFSLTLGSLLGMVIAGFVGLVVFLRRRLSQVVLLAAVVGIVFGAVWVTVPAVSEHLDAANSRVAGRFATYHAGFQVVKSHPWLGVGAQNQVLAAVVESSARSSGVAVSVVPHNAFLAITTEKGVFGGLLLIILVVNILRVLFRTRPRMPQRYFLLHAGISLGCVAFLIQNMSNLLIMHARLGVVLLALVVLDVRLRQLPDDATGAAGDPQLVRTSHGRQIIEAFASSSKRRR